MTLNAYRPEIKTISAVRVRIMKFGGPEEIRTPDPYNANVMRSQLRYGPISLSESRTIITLIHRNVKENLVPY